MEIKYEKVLEGPGPSEVLIRIKTVGGTWEELAIPRNKIAENGYVEATMIDEKVGQVLVELPRESVSGNWRIWVEKVTTRERPGTSGKDRKRMAPNQNRSRLKAKVAMCLTAGETAL